MGDADGLEKPPECFVCLEASRPLFQPCQCRHHVHAHCFVECIQRVPAHAERCPVCRQAYAVRMHTRRRPHCDLLLLELYAMAIGATGGLVVLLVLAEPSQWPHVAFLAVRIMLVSMVAMLWWSVAAAHGIARRLTGQWCPCRLDRTVVGVELGGRVPSPRVEAPAQSV